MAAIEARELPGDALLQRYRREGAYTDCYATTLGLVLGQSDFVRAFYCSWVFKLERVLLQWLVNRPSTDEQARQLASGSDADFAAWGVEARAERQLLMCDMSGRTRSWLMTLPSADGASTELYFGSVVVARKDAGAGNRQMGLMFGLLLGFHRIYSRVLLAAAAASLRRDAHR
ncbi:MAG: hypothetical protein AB7E72_14945 [Lysobacterales bacterium]